MLDNIRLQNILFLDIETASQYPSYDELPEKWQKLWEKKSNYLIKEGEDHEDTYKKAAIYAEFGKVICISVGVYRIVNSKPIFRIKSFYGEDEKEVLGQFCELLRKSFTSTDYLLCAHNGKEFDFPFLARRILVNQLKLPYLLDIAGRKPWEVQHLDTMQLWKFGDYKHYTSLEVLARLFGIDSPKEEIDGSDVGRLYWEEKDIKRIVKYCQSDTLTVAQILLAYQGKPLIKSNQIEISD